MDLTVVLPARNEAENLGQLVPSILATFDRHGIDGEVFVIDDYSTDVTPDVLAQLESDRVRSTRFPVNLGRAHGIAAGFHHAKGDAVAVMDSDRQYDPEDLPKLLAALASGADVANGVRVDRADNPWRRTVSRTYNAIVMRAALDVRVEDANSGLKMFTADAIERMGYDPSPLRRGHRFLIAWAVATDLEIAEVPIKHFDRPAGRSYIKAFREARLTMLDLWTFRRTVIRPRKRRSKTLSGARR